MNKELIITTATATAEAATQMEKIIKAAASFYRTEAGLEAWKSFSCAFDKNAQRLFDECAGNIELAEEKLARNRAYFNRCAIKFEKAHPGCFGRVQETTVYDFLEAFGL